MWGKKKNKWEAEMEKTVRDLENKVYQLERENLIRIGPGSPVVIGRDYYDPRPSLSLQKAIYQILGHLNLQFEHKSYSESVTLKEVKSAKGTIQD